MSRETPMILLFILACLSGAIGAQALAASPQTGDLVTVRAQVLPEVWRAYGRIEPMAVVRVRAVEPGTLIGLKVVPGSVVAAGEQLGHLAGPRMQALLTARQSALNSAQTREAAAGRKLAIARRQLAARLGTRQAVDTAQSELAAARASARTAQAKLQESRALETLHAPAAGTVIAVQAANGEQVTAGETILTLQPNGKLWLRAAYYGADAAQLRVGMKGRFRPSGDGQAIPVKVTAIAPGLAADDGRRVGLLPTVPVSTRSWLNGQWGTVVLEGPPRRMVVVPTSALILDRGKWWVLVHTGQGDKPQRVVPGPSRGWRTWLVSGLRPGQQVVARDAFLKYHRGIAQSYQPPD